MARYGLITSPPSERYPLLYPPVCKFLQPRSPVIYFDDPGGLSPRALRWHEIISPRIYLDRPAETARGVPVYLQCILPGETVEERNAPKS